MQNVHLSSSKPTQSAHVHPMVHPNQAYKLLASPPRPGAASPPDPPGPPPLAALFISSRHFCRWLATFSRVKPSTFITCGEFVVAGVCMSVYERRGRVQWGIWGASRRRKPHNKI